MKDLPTLIYEAKNAVYSTTGQPPNILDLPLKLYYQLVFTLSERFGNKELYLDEWEGMKINILWQNSDTFIVRHEQSCGCGDGSYENPIFYPDEK